MVAHITLGNTVISELFIKAEFGITELIKVRFEAKIRNYIEIYSKIEIQG